jgi:uncharacterized protein YebE (UPF0316 family)
MPVIAHIVFGMPVIAKIVLGMLVIALIILKYDLDHTMRNERRNRGRCCNILPLFEGFF